MSKNRKIIILSWLAHLIVAIILCDQVQSILKRILLLVSIGIICGINSVCINNTPPSKSHDNKQKDTNSAA